MIKKTENIVHGLWIGDKLSPLELLTLHSFIKQGYTFQLWVYDEIRTPLPTGIILADANTIIPEHQIFRKKKADPTIGLGAGSYGTFSDIFRYKLLYEKGGIWTDMDISCLKHFDFRQPYFFRHHPFLPVIGNIMKCPKGGPLMLATYEETVQLCNEDSSDWLMTNKILNKHIERLNLQKYIHTGVSNPDLWNAVIPFINSNKEFPEEWYFVHWMNEEWRTQALEKNRLYKKSALFQLIDRYGIKTEIKKKDWKYYSWYLKNTDAVQWMKVFIKNTPIYELFLSLRRKE